MIWYDYYLKRRKKKLARNYFNYSNFVSRTLRSSAEFSANFENNFSFAGAVVAVVVATVNT